MSDDDHDIWMKRLNSTENAKLFEIEGAKVKPVRSLESAKEELTTAGLRRRLTDLENTVLKLKAHIKKLERKINQRPKTFR